MLTLGTEQLAPLREQPQTAQRGAYRRKCCSVARAFRARELRSNLLRRTNKETGGAVVPELRDHRIDNSLRGNQSLLVLSNIEQRNQALGQRGVVFELPFNRHRAV